MKVREVMTHGVLTCHENDRLKSVMQKMVMRRCGAIPVVDDGMILVGIVSTRDVLLPLYPNYGEYVHDTISASDFEAMEAHYPRVMQMKVKEVMSTNPISVDPEMPVLKAASVMGLKNLRRIPVTEGGRLVGMISIGDISRALFIRYASERP